jgi:hypothetical protein
VLQYVTNATKPLGFLFGFALRTDAIGEPMGAIARYLSKLLVGAVVGALLGVLVVGTIVGYGWGISAIVGACVGAALITLYGPATIIHSEPTIRGATHPKVIGEISALIRPTAESVRSRKLGE